MKPANIIVTLDKKIAKLCDLELIKIQEHIDSSYFTVKGVPRRFGTFPFMAPEIFSRRSHYSAGADLWSFGITAIKLYIQMSAFNIKYKNVENKMKEIFAARIVPKLDEVPAILQPLLRRCLHYDQEDRICAANFIFEFEYEGIA